MTRPTAPKPAEPDHGRGAPGHTRPRACCPHCGTAVEGTADAFCCHGCEAAAAIIREAGLERYYAERTDYAPRPEPGPGEAADWSRVPTTLDHRGQAEARLAIDGLRCASCVWVTEKVLERTPGVAAATVSYATGRTTLRWDPARITLPALARRIAALGYHPRPLDLDAAPDRSLMLRLAVAAIVTIAVMGLYEGLYAGWWYGAMDPRYAALFRWTSLALSTPVALWCAAPFFQGAWHGLRHGLLHMDLPIALGVAVTWIHGIAATLLGQDAYLDSLTMLVALLLAGRVLEARGRRRATEAAAALAATVPRSARRLQGDRVEVVPVTDLQRGDRVDVAAGEEVPADGRVVEGSGQVRMALLTGESDPVLVGPGDRVVAGALLADGALTVLVEAVGQETAVHRMAAELRTAQDRGMTPTSADRIAPWFTAATLLVAAITGISWWAAAGSGTAVARTVAVLVVACPCALALAQPLAAAAGLGAAARRGLLLRSGDALLRLGRADTAGVDKTGTVTAGTIAVVEADDVALRRAAGLERFSAHPIARAITAEAARRGIPLPLATEVRETPGRGICGMVDGRQWELRPGGPGEVVLAGEGEEASVIRLGDATRQDAGATLAALRELGLRTALITGDHPEVADRIGRAVGADRIVARMDPEAKAAWVRHEQAAGRVVLFAGDGVNDGPALAAADVGIAMAAGAASSVLVADGIVSTPALAPVVAGIRAGRAAEEMTRLSQNQALIYNLLAVGAAAAGLVNPLVAALLMPMSSALVIWNALRVEKLVRSQEP